MFSNIHHFNSQIFYVFCSYSRSWQIISTRDGRYEGLHHGGAHLERRAFQSLRLFEITFLFAPIQHSTSRNVITRMATAAGAIVSLSNTARSRVILVITASTLIRPASKVRYSVRTSSHGGSSKRER